MSPSHCLYSLYSFSYGCLFLENKKNLQELLIILLSSKSRVFVLTLGLDHHQWSLEGDWSVISYCLRHQSHAFSWSWSNGKYYSWRRFFFGILHSPWGHFSSTHEFNVINIIPRKDDAQGTRIQRKELQEEREPEKQQLNDNFWWSSLQKNACIHCQNTQKEMMND